MNRISRYTLFKGPWRAMNWRRGNLKTVVKIRDLYSKGLEGILRDNITAQKHRYRIGILDNSLLVWPGTRLIPYSFWSTSPFERAHVSHLGTRHHMYAAEIRPPTAQPQCLRWINARSPSLTPIFISTSSTLYFSKTEIMATFISTSAMCLPKHLPDRPKRMYP